MITHLVTRPQADQEPFASELRLLGREVCFDAVFDIVFQNSAELDLSDVQAVLFTSANGVRAYQLNSKDRSFPALCVGESSAEAARECGFEMVYSANGDVGDLAKLVQAKLSAKKHEFSAYCIRPTTLYHTHGIPSLASPCLNSFHTASLSLSPSSR